MKKELKHQSSLAFSMQYIQTCSMHFRFKRVLVPFMCIYIICVFLNLCDLRSAGTPLTLNGNGRALKVGAIVATKDSADNVEVGITFEDFFGTEKEVLGAGVVEDVGWKISGLLGALDIVGVADVVDDDDIEMEGEGVAEFVDVGLGVTEIVGVTDGVGLGSTHLDSEHSPDNLYLLRSEKIIVHQTMPLPST